MVGLKTATAVGLRPGPTIYHRSNMAELCNTNDLEGCECNILGACDTNGNQKQDWNKYLPRGADQFGYVVLIVQNLRYVCEDPESQAILLHAFGRYSTCSE